jgi:hypothetical protein
VPSDNSGKMGRAAGSCDEDLGAISLRSLDVLDKSLWGAMGR